MSQSSSDYEEFQPLSDESSGDEWTGELATRKGRKSAIGKKSSNKDLSQKRDKTQSVEVTKEPAENATVEAEEVVRPSDDVDGYSKGDDVAERCTELGLVLSDVEGWLQEPPFPPARQVSNPYREVVWKLGRDLTQRGFSRKEAGKLVNASGSTMKRWLGQDCYHEPALPTGRPTGNTIFDRHPTAFPLVESLARQVRADEELDMPASELLALSFTAITGEAVTASTIRKKFVKDGAGLGILRLPSPHPVAVSYLNSKSNTDDEFHQAKKEMDEAIQRELNSPSFIPDPDFELL